MISELRTAGAEAIEINDAHQSLWVRCRYLGGRCSWVADYRQQGTIGVLVFDSGDLQFAYARLGDEHPRSAERSVKCVGRGCRCNKSIEWT